MGDRGLGLHPSLTVQSGHVVGGRLVDGEASVLFLEVSILFVVPSQYVLLVSAPTCLVLQKHKIKLYFSIGLYTCTYLLTAMVVDAGALHPPLPHSPLSYR